MTHEAPTDAGSARAKSAKTRVGELIDGRYKLLAKLGSGGAADVWRVLDTKEGLDAPAALKFLRSGASPEQRERLRREARLMGQLDSPHILRTEDVSLGGDTPYLRTRAVEGNTLHALLEQHRGKPLDSERVLMILDELLAALSVVHAAQFVHRDVTPRNVFIEDLPDGSERVLLLDFGLAEDLRVESTATGPDSGTAQCMSPERLQDTAPGPTFAQDTYAVGLIAYELVTGERPFAGESREAIRAFYARGERLSVLAVPSHLEARVARTPTRLRAVIERALEPDPGLRWQNAAALRDALEDAIEPIAAELEEGLLFDNRYRVEGKLGQGGMGAVYTAIDTTYRNQRVALKVLALPSFLQDEELLAPYVQRFKREAAILMRVHHPNLPAFLGEGRAGRLWYYAMEFIEGERLTKAAPALGWSGVVPVIRDIANALDALHAADVVHRDVKDANIVVRTADGAGVLVDPGIARLGGSELTEEGHGLGTPGYEAPEHASNARGVTAAADTYSLAATVYRLITGATPPSYRERDAAVPATQFRVGSTEHDVPRPVAHVLERALHPLVSERYESATAFASALSRTTDTPPQLVGANTQTKTPASTTERVVGERRSKHEAAPTSRRGVAWLAAVTAVAAVGVGTWSLTGGADKGEEKAPLSEPRLMTGGEPAASKTPVVATSPDAGSPDARARDAAAITKTTLTVRTRRNGREVEGIELVVAGKRYKSPARFDAVIGTPMTAQVRGRKYAGHGQWTVDDTATDIWIDVTRRKKHRGRTPAKGPADYPVEDIRVIRGEH